MIIDRIDFRLANDLAELEPLVRALDCFGEAVALPPKTAHRLTLAIDEFVNNAVDYGYPDHRQGEITVSIRHRVEHLEIVIADDGDAFDPLTAPAPDLSGSIEERRIGGLGVHLVRTLATSFAYRREDGRNVVTLALALDA
ncbi:ATP-binding protein [Ancylobacter defluvii]|uniref:Histidine kinase n=1 Tax=Ancylobacter defluvii TaxID=1282440 RepID=A0A9W6JY91_9HYPH|nr:ATP-binding protein [Ancylobacter defluvii]MBS7589129.1 ATP-binding protein [Ancylobacter defluvii]GLK84741.1 histidine kinase [Ancylobacter defluvii]